MRFANLTDVGRQREHNEDNLLSVVFSFCDGSRRADYALHVVADGMGGAAAGEVASALTVETLAMVVYRELLASHANADQAYVNPANALTLAIEQANERVYTTAREIPQFLGMGATVTAALVCQGKAYIAQVGDSRGYMIRRGRIVQLTRDHSYVGELLREGRITEEQARNHPRRNVILRAVGSRLRVEADVTHEVLEPGDVLLLCSDGLSGLVTDEEMESCVRDGIGRSREPRAICEELIDRANVAGGADNISVALVVIDPADVPAGRMDQVCLLPGVTLTWDEAVRLELPDSSFVKVEL
jgi:protein phosphatase